MAKTWRTLLISGIVDREIRRIAKDNLRGRLIDIGCGTRPFESLVEPYVKTYIGLDREQPFNADARVDLVGTAYSIPTEAESFDCALSTAALEHLAEPEQALRECQRVLKRGGVAVYTVPHIWHLHAEPDDFFRFTKYGLRHLFEKVGFEVVEIRALAGFWVTAATLSCYYIGRFNRSIVRLVPVIPLIGVLIQGAAWLLDKIDRAEEWTWMYSVVARKP